MRRLLALRDDQRGNVLMLTGLAILILFAVAGAGVDFGRQQLVRMKLQNASDAAAVAAASLPDSVSAEQRRQVALRYYNLNFPSSYLGIARPSPNIQIGSQIIVDASTSMNANFVSNVGVQTLEAQGRTVVERATDQNSIYDVLLVMDNSGSMGNITTAPNFAETPQLERQNARNLINIFCTADAREYAIANCAPRQSYYMANLTTQRTYSNTAICRSTYPNEYCSYADNGPTRFVQIQGETYPTIGYGLTGDTRLNALRRVALDFVTRVIDEGQSGSRVGLVGWAEELLVTQALSNNSTTNRNRINSLAAFGGTNPGIGLREAIRLGSDFNQTHIKAVVLLSDGKPTLNGPYNSSTRTDTSGCNGRSFCEVAVNTALPLCTQLKNSGVQVYTVGFLNPNDQEFTQYPGDYQRAVAFMRSCASVDGEGNPRFYTAQNGAELDQAFTQILTSLGRIRISQ